MRSRRRLAAAALPVAAAAALGAATWADRRAVARDPMRRRLSSPPGGEVRSVLTADGARLHVELFGPADGVPVVLLHGWTCALRFWALQIPVLAQRCRVVAVDLRGHGRSDAGHLGDLGLGVLGSDLDAVLAATTAPGSRPILVGHSMGAMTIAAWAARHPGGVRARIRGAALINTGVSRLTEEVAVLPGVPLRLRAVLTAAAQRSRLPIGPATPLSFRAIRRIALSRHASPATVAFCEEMILATPPRVRAGYAHGFGTLDLERGLHGLDVPTLLLGGDDDLLTPSAHLSRIASRLPDLYRRVDVPRAGHMTPLERPDVVNAALLDLIDAVGV